MATDPVRALVEARPTMFDHRSAGMMPALQVNDHIHGVEALSNIYLINTSDGDIQINAGMGFEAPTIREQFAPYRKGPLRYIILTQGHVDHVGGVDQLREPDTKLVAQQDNPQCQKDDERIGAARNRQSQVWFPTPWKNNEELEKKIGQPVQDRPVPDITFAERMDIELGDKTLELHSVPGGETTDSIAIRMPESGLVFSGNMLGPLFPHFPNIYTIRGDKYRFWDVYLSSLRYLRDLEPETLVTGHFAPIEGKELIRTCLDRLHDAVTHVHQQTLDGMNAGKDIFTLMREISIPEELYVGQAYGKVSLAVRTVWEQYMGWFHGKRTSQLLSVQPEHIQGELVELNGVDAVVERGRHYLDSGDAERATVFSEAALASRPDHPPGLQLALDAHQALLADPLGHINFWYAGWLRHEIDRIGQELAKGIA